MWGVFEEIVDGGKAWLEESYRGDFRPVEE